MNRLVDVECDIFIILIVIIIGILLLSYYVANANHHKKVEHLVLSDSNYSPCKVGCLVACSSLKPPYKFLGADCYNRCVEICPNYSPGVRGTDK